MYTGKSRNNYRNFLAYVFLYVYYYDCITLKCCDHEFLFLEAKELLTIYRGDLSLFVMAASGVLFYDCLGKS